MRGNSVAALCLTVIYSSSFCIIRKRAFVSVNTFSVGSRNAVCGSDENMMLEFGSAISENSASAVLVSSSPPRISAFDGHQSPLPSPDKQTATDFRKFPDEFLRMAKWKIDDLSFLVGSDLAIFGTKLHPCISLRLR